MSSQTTLCRALLRCRHTSSKIMTFFFCLFVVWVFQKYFKQWLRQSDADAKWFTNVREGETCPQTLVRIKWKCYFLRRQSFLRPLNANFIVFGTSSVYASLPACVVRCCRPNKLATDGPVGMVTTDGTGEMSKNDYLFGLRSICDSSLCESQPKRPSFHFCEILLLLIGEAIRQMKPNTERHLFRQDKKKCWQTIYRIRKPKMKNVRRILWDRSRVLRKAMVSYVRRHDENLVHTTPLALRYNYAIFLEPTRTQRVNFVSLSSLSPRHRSESILCPKEKLMSTNKVCESGRRDEYENGMLGASRSRAANVWRHPPAENVLHPKTSISILAGARRNSRHNIKDHRLD